MINSKPDFESLLKGGDLRSLGKSSLVLSKIKSKSDFSKIFKLLYNKDAKVVMRAADVIEKITINEPLYLENYTQKVFDLCKTESSKELQWHLALLLPRLKLNKPGINKAWMILKEWCYDKTRSRITRVNALQGLHEITRLYPDLITELQQIFFELERENIPSVNARIKKLRKLF